MQKLILTLVITLLINVSLFSQNWYTFAGSNQKNGLTENDRPGLYKHPILDGEQPYIFSLGKCDLYLRG
jgi:hypothetical protein